ncbi:hypothetical protein [Brevibacillus laterosporus]|uniref:hypothetical protein n=1 Tax=Brevibacillus laterosporus TaxID=1465 RepID=UPI002653DEAF|nr:hypothetical protein [Brevibacillus laterosporus]MDN9008990.1 hypothetical protein [Brevibacillus laterosporus]MDO0941097.1 hypothetical protein [Brevibacillus laterosporus]
MSKDLLEMLEELHEDKQRYVHYLEQSKKSLSQLTMTKGDTHCAETLKLLQATESEVETLQKLISYIDFKIKLLRVKEYAS